MIRSLIDYRRLKHHQYHANLKQLRQYQWRQLRRIIKIAKEKSPFYQALYQDFHPVDLTTFGTLPTIDKSIMMTHFNRLNTVGLDKDDVMAFAREQERKQDYLGYYQNRFVVGLSSGTSGNKGLFVTPKTLTKRLPAVFLARGGMNLSDLPLRILFLLRVFSQGFQDINAPLLKLRYLSTMTAPSVIIGTLNEMNANILMAPPSLLRVILPIVKTIKVPIKKVVTYAEVLTDEDKQRFEQAFDAKVIEIYQASEGQIASPCKSGRLHINEDLVYVELFDAEGAPIDQPGVTGHRMLITNLVNTVQPLIRYEMNDMIVLDEPCACGSSFRTIKKVLGRQDDVVYVWDQNQLLQPVFPDLMARWIITESDLIREFQVIQKQDGRLEVKLDLTGDYPLDAMRQRLTDELGQLGLHADIIIDSCALTLPQDKNKYKRFMRIKD